MTTNVTRTSVSRMSARNNDMMNSAINFARDLQVDPLKEEREANCLCKVCFYKSKNYGRVAGQAFTNSDCLSCGQDMLFPNTAIDSVCYTCAVKLDICKHCGGDIDMRERRKDWGELS